MGLFGKPPEGNKPAVPPPASPPRPSPPPPTLPAATATGPAHRPPASPPVPAPAPPRPAGAAICVVGANTTIKGEILGDEDVLVEGTVEGQIRIARELRVGPGGRVKASISAQSVVVSGEVVGDCEASARVEIHASGRLSGNIRAPRIVIAEGAIFRGNSDMSGRREDRKEKAAIS
jgi:cytoskeletal protein CcmA (bactofilin family)